LLEQDMRALIHELKSPLGDKARGEVVWSGGEVPATITGDLQMLRIVVR
jgi:hypothetical protein